MKTTELRAKSTTECQSILKDLLREQFNLRMQHATGQASRPSRIRELRREIARVKTIMNEQRG